MNLKKLLNEDYSYPKIDDQDLQYKLYKKREFYYHKITEDKELTNYDDIKKYRDDICSGRLKLYSHQSFLSNLINPNTPYKGLLVFHGVGTGKTGSAISICENFKSMTKKYGTKIYILVPGPILKENWKDEIIKFTYNNIINDIINKNGIMNKEDLERIKKEKLKDILQNYKIMTHRSFYKKVLGEKIKDIKFTKAGTIKQSKYRLNDKGEIERELSIDRIESLDNTLLVVDEVHNFTGNEHGEALEKIIKKSSNLKLLLLSATPMKNLADDIIELINYLRPNDDKIKRDKIFSSNKDHNMELKPNGEEYFKNMTNGYISYFRGAHPLTFAKRNIIGEIIPGLLFTKCIRCDMLDFQYQWYMTISSKTDDPLERSTSSISNIVLPGLSKDKKEIQGFAGEEGINIIKSNLKTNKNDYLKKLNEKFFKGKIKNVDEIIYESKNTDNITGIILKKEYLQLFSSKFYTVLENIEQKVDTKKGSGTIFIYSNLVKVGIEIFQEILLQNGYLEFREDQQYEIKPNTVDYKTGKTFEEFNKNNYSRKFIPSTFIRITGKTDDDEELPDVKKKILDNYFNNEDNIEGKLLKIILGSKVMNEGVTLENTSEVHILDVYYNLGRLEQVMGRAIRQCKHYKLTSEKNPFPSVDIYKYVVKLKNNKLSSEENLYKKAESKYILIKKIERYLKEVSIDCPINYNGNIFKNEIKLYNNCSIPSEKNSKNMCPESCDFMNCVYKCYNKKLNLEYYDKNSSIYKKIKKIDLDYRTFTDDLAKSEINFSKSKIKQLFKLKFVYTLDEILKFIKSNYKDEQYELFEDWFVYKALDDMIPIDDNDFLNFQDTIYDKYNNMGYLIYRGKFYIFQSFDENENLPLFYRKKYLKELYNELSLYSYLKLKNIDIDKLENKKENINKNKYDFDTNIKYYENREEYEIVGIIDKFSGKRKLAIGNDDDIFKIRDKLLKNKQVKRGTGIQSMKGSVCYSSKDKNELKNMSNKININFTNSLSRFDTCDFIKEKLLYLEKYSEGKDKMTYIIIPNNHERYLFPFNLFDRIKYIEDEFNKLENANIKISFKKDNNGIFLNKRDKKYTRYLVEFNYKENISKNTKLFLKKYGIEFDKNKYKGIIE